MQYTPVYALKGYRVTETYVIDDVIYEAEIEVKSQGWSAGLAGYDPHGVEVSLSADNHLVGVVSISFPLTRKSDPVRYVYGDLHRPTFSEEAKHILSKAVCAFLAEKRLYATINRNLERFSYRAGQEYTT